MGRTITVEQNGQCEYFEPPNDVDIVMAICKLKNGKATGHDQIPAELIKERGKELMKVIYELMSKILEEEFTPHEWKYGIICPILKKWDVPMCDNYRAVILLCTTYMLLASIVHVKIPYAVEMIVEY
jgi:hypothetical protein